MTESEFSAQSESAKQMIMRMLLRLNPNRAEDLWQDTLLRAFSRRHTFRGECRFSTWLCRIAMTTAHAAWRGPKHRREREMVEVVDCIPSPDMPPLAVVLIEERREMLHGLVSRLPALERQAVRLQLHGLTLRETAATLGCTVQAVKSRRSRALRLLRAGARTKCEKVRRAAPHSR